MPRRADTEQVDAVGRESALTRGGRVAFGGLLERAKAGGQEGTKNGRGDFTMAELRAQTGAVPAAESRAIDAAVRRGATGREAERHVTALAGAVILAVREGRGIGAPGLVLTAGHLALGAASWLLREDGRELARDGDEPGHALAQLDALTGRTVTAARLRRRDGALALLLDDDLGAPALELSVRGPRRRGAERWELATPDGLLVVAGPGGAFAIGPDEARRG